jgi:hypothetical protein
MEPAVMEHRDWDNGSETGSRDLVGSKWGIMGCAGLSRDKACYYTPSLIACLDSSYMLDS